jgi:hypothetical protein
MQTPVNQRTGLETNLQSQASSPAQNESEGSEREGADRREQPALASAEDEQNEGKRRGSSDEDEGERYVEADSNELANEQASQWLKAVLPEMTNGWWDVYPKGRGFAVKFCWRDPDRQTLTFPRISHQELQALRQSDPDEARRFMRDRIFAGLRKILIDPDKRDKATLVARKLGIALDDLQ